MILPKTQEQFIIASNPTALPLSLNIETLKVLLVYGGIPVAIILTITIFMKVFMEKLTKMLRNSNEQNNKPKKQNKTLLKK